MFLLIVLPLQISWAVAATYCQHETGSTQHFGHHDISITLKITRNWLKLLRPMWTMIVLSVMQAVLPH